MHLLFIDFKKAYDLVRREVLYNILIEFGIHIKISGLTKCVLNETYSRVWVGRNLSGVCIKNGLKEGGTTSLLHLTLLYRATRRA
jgi:hypothetical protein